MLEKIASETISLERALKWITQVAVALHSLHEKNHIHRDVKPENIFIDENDNAHLGDLGTVSLKLVTRSGIGSDGYVAPEVIKAADDYSNELTYDDKADVWSLGRIFGELLIGRQLKKHDN